ncbi:MAG: alanine--glyoxylate aminotransferase family protein [Chrysiogenetes bacterium]|nr:alanine--glyoxylate aminotransferase family protein [Chrysiogenetes bacterium]
MMKKRLMTPGPTPVLQEALAAMSQPILHHRTPQFSAIFREAAAGLKPIFGTKEDVLILAGSGTAAMEGSVVNLLSPGEKALCINGGKFGERWGKICQAHGMEVIELKSEWGHPIGVDEVKKALEANPDIRAVYATFSETSTATVHPIQEIAALTRNSDALLVVDGITAVGCMPVPMDEWGIDVLVSGSQKAFMLPPGLAFVALSERAWKRTEEARSPKFYLDFKKERKALHDDTTAYTPAVSLIIGLLEVVRAVEAEGIENLFARHKRLADATRAGLAALGLKAFSAAPADSVTAVWLPEGVDGGKFVKYARDQLGLAMAGGQDHVKGKIIRVSHMGFVDGFDTLSAIAAVEMALAKFGQSVELGKGVAAAQKVLIEGFPNP